MSYPSAIDISNSAHIIRKLYEYDAIEATKGRCSQAVDSIFADDHKLSSSPTTNASWNQKGEVQSAYIKESYCPDSRPEQET